MANPWFKFYGGEYLSDPKILQLNADERSCWVTLLCLASQTKDGTIRFLSENQLLTMSGVVLGSNILEKFEKLDMVEICNGNVTVKHWLKRQLSESVNRVREHRLKQKSNAHVTTEEIRVEENRREKKPEHSLSYLKKIPETDLEEFYTRFDCSKSAIKSKAEDLYNYCQAKGRTYKNYRAFLLNAIKKDFPVRRGSAQIVKVEPEEPKDKAKIMEEMKKGRELLGLRN